MTGNKRGHGAVIGRLLAGAAVAALVLQAGGALAQERTKIEWWHALGGRLAEIVDKLIVDFNASQDKYELVGINKGNYE
ncbi:MAG TPA: hypothetical protein VGV07_00305, partial [Devosia sp.]|nr:hypothetical protein [Devosia sp.]